MRPFRGGTRYFDDGPVTVHANASFSPRYCESQQSTVEGLTLINLHRSLPLIPYTVSNSLSSACGWKATASCR